jgi:integrase
MAKHKNRYVCTLKYNGTRKYFSAKTKHEAENMRDAFIDRYINPSSQEQLSRETLFTDWLDHYIEDARHNVREQTLESYNVLVEKHIKPGLGSYHLADLTTAVIKKFLYGKIDDGYSHRTVNYLRVIIGAALNLAVDEDILVKTPMHKIPPFAKQPKRRRIALDETSLQKFLSVVDDPQLHFMYLLDVSLGLRREELLGLTWKEINLDDCYLNVANTLIGFNGGTLTPLTKNSSSRRQIYFNEDIRQGF